MEVPFSFSLKQQRLHKTHRNHKTSWPCDFPGDFHGKLKKNCFSRSFQEDLKFPGVSRSVATLNKSKHIFRVHIKDYWHFDTVTPKQHYTIFQTSKQLTFSESYWPTILHTFPELKSNNTNIFRELLANNTKHFSRVYIKQYWHFQRIPSKSNCSRKFFQSSYHTILTLSESYCQTIMTYLELISNSIHILTELLPNSSKHSFESLNGHMNRKKILSS